MASSSVSHGRLFRPASLRARELAWQGRASLSLGLPATFTSLASIGLAVALFALFVFGSYPRRVDLRGVVLPSAGLIGISAPSAGWISAVSAKEGDTVQKGAAIYTLQVGTDTKHGNVERRVSDVLSGERDTLQQQIERKTQLTQETREHLQRTVENLNAQIRQTDTQLGTRQAFFKATNQEYQLSTQLFERNQIARNDFSVHKPRG